MLIDRHRLQYLEEGSFSDADVAQTRQPGLQAATYPMPCRHPGLIHFASPDPETAVNNACLTREEMWPWALLLI